MENKIYIFGNELLEEDNIPIKLKKGLAEKFKNIEFEIKDPSENLHPDKNKTLTIIDTAQGIEKVEYINSLEHIETNYKPCSLHDFDLAFNLKILKSLKLLEKVHIIAIPQNMKQEKAFNETVKIIESLFPINS